MCNKKFTSGNKKEKYCRKCVKEMMMDEYARYIGLEIENL